MECYKEIKCVLKHFWNCKIYIKVKETGINMWSERENVKKNKGEIECDRILMRS